MNDPAPPRQSEDFIQAIKEKYSSIAKPPRATPASTHRTADPPRPTPKTLAPSQSNARLDRSNIINDYLTLRRKYEEKTEQSLPQAVPERDEGVESTNKSSPIKRFYDTPKNDYLAVRRQQIEQAHQQRASQHRLERELNQRAIADIDSLLASIRNTFSGYKYQSM